MQACMQTWRHATKQNNVVEKRHAGVHAISRCQILAGINPSLCVCVCPTMLSPGVTIVTRRIMNLSPLLLHHCSCTEHQTSTFFASTTKHNGAQKTEKVKK